MKRGAFISIFSVSILLFGFIFYQSDLLIAGDTSGLDDRVVFKPSELHLAFGGEETDAALSVAAVDDSNYVIVGHTNSFGTGSSDGFVMLMNENGEVLWNKSIGDEESDVITDVMVRNQLIYFSGYTTDPVSLDLNAMAGVLNLDGQMQWYKCIGDDRNDIANAAYPLEDGSVIISGNTTKGKDAEAFFTRLDEQGNILWSTSVEGELNEIPDVIKENDGELYIGGVSNSVENERYDIALYHLNLQGELKEMIVFGTQGYDHFGDMEFTDNGLAINGSYSPGVDGPDNIFLLQLDKDFNIEWARTAETNSFDKLFALEWRKGMGYYMAGVSRNSKTYREDILMVHLDKSGTVTCSVNLRSKESEYPNDMILSDQGELILAGQKVLVDQGSFNVMFAKAYDSGWDLPWRIKRLWLKAQPIECTRAIVHPKVGEGPGIVPAQLKIQSIEMQDTCLFYNREARELFN